MNFRRLRPDEIDCRVGQVTAKGYTLLLYKDARCDMNILDETLGIGGWQRKHYELKGNLFCSVGVKVDGEWVWKDDCGTESNTEKEKGEASDSFKRACFNLGIGRELYTSPFIFVSCETIARKDGKGYDLPTEHKYLQPKVEDIEYDEKGNICSLVIVDKYDNRMFAYFAKNDPKTAETKKSNNLVVGGNYLFSSGKYKGKTIKQVAEEDDGYLKWLLDSEKVSENIKRNIEVFYEKQEA